MTDANSGFLAGRAALVTGGSRGIGLATAEALRAAGADVLVCGRSRPVLDRARSRIEAAPGPGRVAAVAADVRRHDEAERLVAAAVEDLGRLDILVNNAGVGRFAPIGELSVDAWVETIETNLSGVFYCCRAAIPAMKR
ncbi:MAG: SDR family NAD(P)-dependent oxidoreductase, partial [Acidobacteria bacterium]|nr:SDR family NAD(P)-dependent oxidoreductase [Acidobacteriota bacterium]